jgi:tRNA(Ile)-lysidine synthase
LRYSRRELLDYARKKGLDWLEDPSNADQSFDRNFLRARVLPVLRERWPGCASSFSRAAAHCAEAQGLIDGLAEEAMEGVRGWRHGTLSVSRLLPREHSLTRAVLRYWISGLELPVPDSVHLSRIQREVLEARPDRSPLVAWRGCEVRRYRDDLFAMPPLPAVPAVPPLRWDNAVLDLPAGLGRLLLVDELGKPLAPVSVPGLVLSVRFGCEGLTCKPAAGSRHRKLKHLFQEAGVPPWLRPYVPLVFSGAELVAVGDLWQCVCSGRNTEVLWKTRWKGGVRNHPGFRGPEEEK